MGFQTLGRCLCSSEGFRVSKSNRAPIHRIADPGDPRLRPFTVLMGAQIDSGATHLVAEGRILAETLSRAGMIFDSILISEVHESSINNELSHIQAKEWLVVPTDIIHTVAGFKFHGGMLALGQRPRANSLRELVSERSAEPIAIVVCDHVSQQDNVGLITRSARAFGVQVVITTVDSGDPLSRRGLRVSMGASFVIPVLTSGDLVADIQLLRQAGLTILGANSSPKSRSFKSVAKPARVALVLGNEARGLSQEVEKLCDEQVHIPMVSGQDSLNVAVAGGILMQHFCQIRKS